MKLRKILPFKIFKNKEKETTKIGEIYNDLDSLTIEEFTNLRDAMSAVTISDSPSAFQARPFFADDENFNTVLDKLKSLLHYGVISHGIFNHKDTLTIEEFTNLREAIYAVSESEKYFANKKNVDNIEKKLRKLLLYGDIRKF